MPREAKSMEPLKPSDLLLLDPQLKPDEVACDTETSGLFADDGARTSTVSIAWIDWTGEWSEFSDRLTYQEEVINADGDVEYVASLAWPFDQGVAGKPEDKGQGMLWSEADNLPGEEWVALCDWLESVGSVIWHNAPFDLEKMRVGPRWAPHLGRELESVTTWCTMNVTHLIYPLLSKTKGGKPTQKLKEVMQILTDGAGLNEVIADEAAIVKKYLMKNKLPTGRWDLMPWDTIGPYADKDARLTIRLKNWQQHDIETGRFDFMGTPDEAYALVIRRLQKAVLPCYRMERRGLPYDEVGSRLAADECKTRAAKVARKLPFKNPTPDQAKLFFFTEGVTDKGVEHLDLPAYEVTDTGAPSLTAEVLTRMVNDGVPHADVWAEYKKVQTAESMWYTGYANKMGADGRLRTRLRPTGTTSSRFSASRVNLQATPQDYRLSDHKILNGIATPRSLIESAVDALEMGGVHWKLWRLDLAQAELRVAADFAQADDMLQMIKDGTDLHSYTTRNLFPDVDPDDPLFDSKWRQVGKRGNFSLCFGSEWKTFNTMVAKETGIYLTEQEGRRIVRDWNGLYPVFRPAIDRHSRKVAVRQAKYGHGWIDFKNKERRWFGKYEETHKAFNQRVQGNLAQFGLDWIYATDQYLMGQGLDEYKAGLVLTVHDSQELLLPATPEGDAMAETCANFGRELWKEWFPGVPGGVDFH
jgi:hypothetical protein